MSKNIEHTMRQLEIRRVNISIEHCLAIASQYSNPTAVILGSRQSLEGVGREKIILIVRNREPITVMTRRDTQTFSPKNFDVQRIVYA